LAAELFDTRPELTGVADFPEDVGSEGALDKLGADAVDVDAQRQIVDDRLDFFAVGDDEGSDDLGLAGRVCSPVRGAS